MHIRGWGVHAGYSWWHLCPWAGLGAMKEKRLSTNERAFLLDSLKTSFQGQPLRLDLRGVHDYRDVKIEFGEEYGQVEVRLGKTYCMCQVSCEVTAPSAHRPSEGFIRYSCELSPMASPRFEPGRPSDKATEITRVVERTMRESRAVDVESLCIVSGKKVWLVRVDLHLLNHDGNIIDAFCLAAIAALYHFRKPFVVVSGGDVIIHSLKDHEPSPLAVYHQPLSVSFAFFHDGKVCVVDPTDQEELVADGVFVMSLNKQNEVCAVTKLGHVALSPEQILVCTQIAKQKVDELSKRLAKALEAHQEKKAAATWSRKNLKRLTVAEQGDMSVDLPPVEPEDLESDAGKLDDDDGPASKPTLVVDGLKTASLFQGQRDAWADEVADAMDVDKHDTTANGAAAAGSKTGKAKKKKKQSTNRHCPPSSTSTTSPNPPPSTPRHSGTPKAAAKQAQKSKVPVAAAADTGAAGAGEQPTSLLDAVTAGSAKKKKKKKRKGPAID